MPNSAQNQGHEARKPTDADRFVGQQMRQGRRELGLTQDALASLLGVTFQQIQKYEKGANRVGASRLQEIARVLNTPVSFFFEDSPGGTNNQEGFAETEAANYVVDFLSSSEGLQLNRSFVKIKDPKVRRKIVEMVRALSDEDE